MARYNPFDAPVPGQSLTDEPGNYPWEHPPQFNQVDEVMENLFDKLTQKDNAENLASMLEAGVPVEAIARVIMFTGFTEGKFSIDLAILMAEPLMKMIAAIGSRAGVEELYISMKKKQKTNTGNELLIRKQIDKASAEFKKEKQKEAEEDTEEEMPKSLMAREEE